jgi:hypothetical protein
MNNLDEKDMLARELRERAGDIAGSHIGFEDVRHSAGRIRRRRNVVTGAVAAVLASVALPTGVAVTSALSGDDGSVDDPIIATSPTATPTPAPTPRPDGTFPLTLEGLPRGDAPQVPYVDDLSQAVVTPDGALPTEIAYQQVTRYADGWLALGYAGDGAQMFMLDADMEVERTFPSGDTFAVSSDGRHVAYVEILDDGTQYLVNAPIDGSDVQAWSFPAQPVLRPVGHVDAGTVVYQTEDARGTVNAGLVDAEGRTPLQGFTTVYDASTATGLVVGQTRSDLVEGSCYGVMDPAASTTEMLWETCDHSLRSLSPDGRYVAGSIPDFDGMGAPSLVVLDAETREVVVEFSAGRNDPTVLFQSVWEDGDTVLGIVNDGPRFTFARFELDGRVVEAGDPVEVDAAVGDIPVWFGAGAW